MATNRASRDLSVGVVVSLGIVIFAVAVMMVSKESRLFVPKVMYWTSFGNTGGLGVGSPVRLVGMQIGTVSRIVFPEDLHENQLRVEFTVDRSFAPRIRAGTKAFLKSLNYLSQDKYIELDPGDPELPVIDPKGYIEPGVSFLEETLQRGESIADDIKEITASFRDFLVAVNKGGGLIQEMIYNPELGRNGARNLEASLTSLHNVLEGVEDGRGLAGAMLTDEAFARKQVENIDASLSHLRSVMEKADSDRSLIGRLTSTDGPGAQAIEDLRAGAAVFRAMAEDLKHGKGLIGRIMSDDAYADALLEKIDAVAGHAESILGKVDRGEGTLGAVVNDPEVYEGLKDIVRGIRKSRIGKGLIRHYEKKGAKARAEDEEATQDDAAGQEEKPPDGRPMP
jgi:phospholipid/cholesterol/gamma-HCH transport system substrate-binding protein